MALAFHIVAHRVPAQVERLVHAILRPETTLILHFDRRAPAPLHELGRKLASAHSNVIIQRPRPIIWGGWQIVHAQLEAMSLALARPAPWTHFITLSGADFPLQPVEMTAEKLGQNADVSYLSWFDPFTTDLRPDARERVERYHIASPTLNRILTIPGIGRRLRALLGWKNHGMPWIHGIRRSYPKEWPHLGGSNWCMLSRVACHWLTTDPAVRAFAKWVRPVMIPDEMFFQSTLRSGRAPGKTENNPGHFVEFSARSPNPTILTLKDLPRLLESSRPFARKFDLSVDAEIIAQLERRVLRQN
jgi:hypothetical protein